MKDKKGFTLIELLAVIVILAVIALIVTPVVTGIIKSAKEQADRRSAEGYVKAAENYYASTLLDQAKKDKLGTNIFAELEVSSKAATKGKVIVDQDGKVYASILINNKCYIKEANQDLSQMVVSNDIENCAGGSSLANTLGQIVLTNFPELELGSNGCKTPNEYKNYSYMGGCYIKGGMNIKAEFIKSMKEWYLVDDTLLNQLFDTNGNFIYAKYEELLVPIIAADYGQTVEELKASAQQANLTVLQYDIGYTEEQISNKKEDVKNYVWYSGAVWEVMGINADSTVRLITNGSVSSIPYNATNNVNFEGSHVDKWLNDYFYNKIESNNILVSSNFCQGAATTTATSRTDCTGGTTLNRKVGLVSVDEINLSKVADTSYIVSGEIFWTMSPYDGSKGWYVGGNDAAAVNINAVNGLHPVINVDANTTVTGGNGLLNRNWTNDIFPYILNKSIDTSVTGLLKDNIAVGEYVKFAGKIYRVVGIDGSGNTKLILDGYYQETAGTDYKMAFGSTSTFDTTYGVGQKLNTSILEWLAPTVSDKAKLVNNYTWYQNNFALGDSYTVSLNEETATRTVSSTVGLIRIGEMLAARSDTISLSANYWTMNPSSATNSVWTVSGAADGNDFTVSTSIYLRPVIVVNSSINIISGNGTPLSPYEI